MAAPVLTEFPKEVALDDGTVVVVRPLRPDDGPALLAFFSELPEDDRYWLKEDVADPAVIERWVRELDYRRVLPLIAVHDWRFIADATLHRRFHGARSHLGEIRVVVHPHYRRRGLGLLLIGELVALAADMRLERLYVEIVSGVEQPALEVVQQAGFERVAEIPGHLRGPGGERHDLIILAMNLA
jgi:GNAT superfamily N-acetyltransferase